MTSVTRPAPLVPAQDDPRWKTVTGALSAIREIAAGMVTEQNKGRAYTPAEHAEATDRVYRAMTRKLISGFNAEGRFDLADKFCKALRERWLTADMGDLYAALKKGH